MKHLEGNKNVYKTISYIKNLIQGIIFMSTCSYKHILIKFQN